MMRYKGALRMEMGKLADLKFAYSQHLAGVVFIDITRFYHDKIPWGFLENLKDGTFLNTKYESKVVTFKPPTRS